jgi:hypothetical protein
MNSLAEINSAAREKEKIFCRNNLFKNNSLSTPIEKLIKK